MIKTEIEIHETREHVSVSEYKDYVQSVSQQVDILQHHMPGLCALSRQTNANTVIHNFWRSNTHVLWFLKSLSQYKEGCIRSKHWDVNSHTSMCPCPHTHMRTYIQVYTHISVKKSKNLNLSYIIYCSSRDKDLIFCIYIYIINLSAALFQFHT